MLPIVWSDSGHGTDFVIDKRGLILTNDRVTGDESYTAVQLDARRKARATVFARDSMRDLAVLNANPSVLERIEPVRLGHAVEPNASVTIGEAVFTIGSPLNQQQVLTTGAASRVDKHLGLDDATSPEASHQLGGISGIDRPEFLEPTRVNREIAFAVLSEKLRHFVQTTRR